MHHNDQPSQPLGVHKLHDPKALDSLGYRGGQAAHFDALYLAEHV